MSLYIRIWTSMLIYNEPRCKKCGNYSTASLWHKHNHSSLANYGDRMQKSSHTKKGQKVDWLQVHRKGTVRDCSYYVTAQGSWKVKIDSATKAFSVLVVVNLLTRQSKGQLTPDTGLYSEWSIWTFSAQLAYGISSFVVVPSVCHLCTLSYSRGINSATIDCMEVYCKRDSCFRQAEETVIVRSLF